ALLIGERVTHMPSPLALGSLAYQTVWVVSVTFVVWFALVAKYSANRLSAFTFLTPLFGVAAGHLVLGEPLTPAFPAPVSLVAAGLVLVNRARRCYELEKFRLVYAGVKCRSATTRQAGPPPRFLSTRRCERRWRRSRVSGPRRPRGWRRRSSAETPGIR